MNMFITFILAIISSMLIDNVVLSRFYGICPFLGVSKKVKSSLGMGIAVVFVIMLATIICWPLYNYVLVPAGVPYLDTVTYILVIASLVQLVGLFIKKYSPSLYKSLGIYLPLITTNCAVLGIAILTIQKNFTLIAGICYCLAAALGFTLAIVIFAGIRERLEHAPIPEAIRGTPIVLITAALLSMAFMGFSGISY